MGHLRERTDKNGRTRYQMLVEVWQGGRKHFKSKTFASAREAKNWEKKIRYEIESGIITKESLKNRKLIDALDRYVAEVLPQRPSNARNVKQHLDWWKGQISATNLSEVLPATIAACRDKLLAEEIAPGKKRAPATCIRYLSSLSAVFEAAIKEWHWCEKNPVRLIRKPTVANARTRFLSEEECRALLESCKQSQNTFLFPIVVIAIGCGLRKGEILGLRWQDVDFNRGVITLERTKNGSMRFVPMVGWVRQVLQEFAQQNDIMDISFQLFPGVTPGKPMDLRNAWYFALKRSGIKKFRFHDLRHSCASFLAMSGASQRDIAEILGHRDLRMTARYSHLSQRHLSDALERAHDKFIKVGV